MLIQMLEGWAGALDKAKYLPATEEKAVSENHEYDISAASLGNGSLSSFDAHSCTLRLLCEVAETPSGSDLLGEALRMLLAPTEMLQGCLNMASDWRTVPSGAVEYLRAQVDGAIRGDCSHYRRECGVPLIQVRIKQKSVRQLGAP